MDVEHLSERGGRRHYILTWAISPSLALLSMLLMLKIAGQEHTDHRRPTAGTMRYKAPPMDTQLNLLLKPQFCHLQYAQHGRSYRPQRGKARVCCPSLLRFWYTETKSLSLVLGLQWLLGNCEAARLGVSNP